MSVKTTAATASTAVGAGTLPVTGVSSESMAMVAGTGLALVLAGVAFWYLAAKKS